MKNMSRKILIIDDDKKLVALIRKYIDLEGHKTKIAFDGPSGFSEIQGFQPDVIILDIMLPGFDGIELLKRLRPISNAYVIMLTAKSEETDKIVGLTLGADDYMVKPFSPRELVARVKAAIRRMQGDATIEPREELEFPLLRINISSHEVSAENANIELTKTEFDLLEFMARNEGIVMSRDKLLRRVWGFDYPGETRVVDVHIGSLRKKLGNIEYIKTVRGVGYKFETKSK